METPGTPANPPHPHTRTDTKNGPRPLTKAPRRIRAEGNANFAWVQHFVYHLSPKGAAGFVLALGALTSNERGEGEIRRKLVEADLVDCIVMLPGKLFLNSPIPVSLWFVSKERHGNGHRDRRGEVLFIDASQLGVLISRRSRVFTDADIVKIAGTYHAWRNWDGDYLDAAGFSKSATLEEIAAKGFVLAPGLYTGSETTGQAEPAAERISRLSDDLIAEFTRGNEIQKTVLTHLRSLGR